MAVVSLDLIHDSLINDKLLLDISLILSQTQLHCIRYDCFLPVRLLHLCLLYLSLLINLPQSLSYHPLFLILDFLLLLLLLLSPLPSNLTVSLSYLFLFQNTSRR